MKVNLISQTKKDKVEDIYSELIDPINKAINKFGENSKEFSDFKKIKYKSFKITYYDKSL
jgi:hypothetical protein